MQGMLNARAKPVLPERRTKSGTKKTLKSWSDGSTDLISDFFNSIGRCCWKSRFPSL